jgi:hypothetical protein
MTICDWKEEWKSAENPWQALEIWEKHWMQEHPDEVRDLVDIVCCGDYNKDLQKNGLYEKGGAEC